MKTTRFVTLMLMSLCVAFAVPTTAHSQVQPLGTVIGNQTVIQVPISASNTMSQALIYYPDDYFLPQNANKRYPLFLFLHGSGEGTSNNITQVTNTSLPQLIAQGLKPYGIDSTTGDTLKFIVVSPHAALTSYSYSYPQVKWIIPYLYSTYRVDTSCVWIGGLSAGGRGTWSCVMEDTILAKRITGIMTLANGGYDNEMTNPVKRQNLDSNVKRGLRVLSNVGTQDPGYNGSLVYRDTVSKYAAPGQQIYHAVINGAHNSGVWNPPFQMNWTGFNPTKNSWDIMASTHRTSTPASSLTASAGVNQIINLPVSVTTLNGTASTPTGTTITGYSWTKLSGGPAVIVSPSLATTVVTGLTQGTYVFRLTVTNSASATATSDVSVTVNAAVQPPSVSAGNNQTVVLPTNSVTLAGSATDPNGTALTYTWTKLSGGPATFSTTSSPTTAVNGLAQGAYTFRLTATNSLGLSNYSDVAVTVNASNTVTTTTGAIKVKKVGCTEYRVSYLFTDSTCRSIYYNPASGKTELMAYNVGGRKVIDVAMGFNVTAMLDDQGYPWVSRTNLITVDQVTTDTLGNPFNNNIAIYGYFYTYVTIKADSTLWYWGGNDYKLFGTNSIITKPIQLSPPGIKFKKVALGSTIVALATNGDIYEWFKNGPITPQKRIIPRPAIDIFASQYNYRGCVIPDPNGNPTMGYPYVWGGDFSFWGGNTAYNEPTSVKTLWNVTVPIKEIIANQNTIHYIDSLGRMFGIGDNANGEVGNGQELVNHADIYPTPYAWSWIKGELYTGAPPQQIAVGTQFKKLFTSNTYNFYMYAQDVNDSVYFWGRDKSMLGGEGIGIYQAATYPNALDVLAPKLVSPISILPTTTVYYNFTPYTINGGTDQTISSSVTTLSGTATPSTLTATGRPTITYSIVGYQWTKISGGSCYITSPTSATTTVTGLSTGVYKFQFKMTDNRTGTIADTVTVYVNVTPPPINQAPTANAGQDQTITLPVNSVTLNGSGTDNDGSIASYQWTKISGPTTFSIASASTAQTAINNLVQGTYQFQLAVTDNQGAVGKDTVVITVNPAIAPPPPPVNQAPVANAGNDVSITLPVNSTSLNGSGTDNDGSITSYQWTKISGPTSYNIANANTAQTNVTGLVQGVYQFQLTVTDNLGATGKDTVIVTVNAAAPPPNQAPTVNAGSDQNITLPVSNTTLSGVATDADGTIVSYQWTRVSGPLQFTIVSSTQPQTDINNLVQGVYIFRLTVTDNQGATGYDDVQITVNAAAPPPPGNQPPTASAGQDQTITLPVNSAALNGSGFDSDGTISSYQWTKISGPASYNIVNATSAQTSVNGLVQGTYQFELTVTDNQGATGKDTMIVVVNPAIAPPPPPVNQAPIANAGNDITITLPVNSVSLSGSGTDYDGTISSYQWNKISGPLFYNIASSGSAQTAVTNLIQGVYKFELTVTDNSGATGKDTVTVIVNPAAQPPVNQAPTASAGADQTITLPTNLVTVNGIGTDVDGSISGYSWKRVSGPTDFNIVSPAQAITEIRNLVEGVYEFELTVTDNQGAIGKDTVKITVLPDPRTHSDATLYPNPATTTLNVKIDAITHQNQTSIRIYDARGVIVYQESFLRTQQVMLRQIDVSRLINGTYFVVVSADINNEVTLKFVKQ